MLLEFINRQTGWHRLEFATPLQCANRQIEHHFRLKSPVMAWRSIGNDVTCRCLLNAILQGIDAMRGLADHLCMSHAQRCIPGNWQLTAVLSTMR